MLRARGIGCELFDSDSIRELGVGIDTLPDDPRTAAVGLLEALDDVAIRTHVLITSIATARKSGAKPAASTPATTSPILDHRGPPQSVIHRAVEERLGHDAIHTGCRLGAFTQDEGGVTAYSSDRAGGHTKTVRGDISLAPTAFIRGCARCCFRMRGRRAGTG